MTASETNFNGTITTTDRDSFLRDIGSAGPHTARGGFGGQLAGNYATSSKARRNITFVGDSLLALGPLAASTAGVPELVVQGLRNQGLTVSPGLCPVYRTSDVGSGAWSFAGTWADPAYDATFVAPVPAAPSGRSVAAAAGSSSNIATWTKPAGVTVASFAIAWVDFTATGTTNFSYSIDNGSWVNVAMSKPSTAAVARTVVSSAVTTNVRVRAADSAGTAVAVPGLIGIEGYSSDSGVTVHNTARGGTSFGQTLDIFLNAFGAGVFPRKWYEWYVATDPDLVILCFSNDGGTRSSGQDSLSAQLPTLARDAIARYKAMGADVLIVIPHNQASRWDSRNAEMRQFYLDLADEFDVGVIDMVARWGDTQEETDGLGFTQPSDTLHATAAGQLDYAAAILRYINTGG